MRQRLNLVGVALVAAIIAWVSLMPQTGSPRVGGFSYMTLMHLPAYFGLAIALSLYFHDTPHGHLEAVIVAAGFGLLIEFVQYGMPTRYFALNDILLNTAGAGLVLLDYKVGVVSTIIRIEDAVLERIFQYQS